MERRGPPRKQQKHVRFGESPEPKPPENMASWLDRQFANHNVQLAAVALISGAAVAGTIYGTQAIRRKERVDELKASIPELNESHHAEMVL
jgi:hypothetical protein